MRSGLRCDVLSGEISPKKDETRKGSRLVMLRRMKLWVLFYLMRVHVTGEPMVNDGSVWQFAYT